MTEQYQANPYVAASAPAPVSAVSTGATYAAPAAAKPKRTGYIVAIVILSILLLGALGVAGCSAMMATTSTMSGLFSSGSTYYTTGDTVAVIDINSTIAHGGGNCSPEGLSELLADAEADDNIKAIVLHVNSGGGSSTAGEEMAILVAQCTKPVIVSSASTNASAAYEISSQADYIFVDKSTFIGAIGTVLQIRDMSGLYEKLGINYQNIISADSKDSSYGTRPLTEEETAYYQAMIDQVNEGFIETVAAGRGMSIEAVRELATGNVFTGLMAVENGLADEIGTFEDAIAYAAEAGGITGSYNVVNISYSSYSLDLLSLLGETDLSVEELAALLEAEGGVYAYAMKDVAAIH